MSETINIDLIEDRKKLAESMVCDIDDWCVKEYTDGHRKHLGASIIGGNCSRELWYGFRWAKAQKLAGGAKQTEGQVLRLFQRGHKEEFSFIKYLEGIGCVFDSTPENQITISDLGGHFGGSMDNVGLLPPRYGITEKVLFEFKTANMAYFNQLKKLGMIEKFPNHWSQMCVYGWKYGEKHDGPLNYGVYLCVDKNTDHLHMEILKLDHDHARHMIDKAGMIITAKEAPAKFSQTPTNFNCKFCTFKGVCHNDEAVDINCRSCVHASAASDKKWVCALAPPSSNIIPDNIIPIGCPSHLGIK